MAPIDPLAPAALHRATDPAALGFVTTDDLPDLDEIVGQRRAVEAVEFAIGVRHEGYNLFALGPAGTGKHTVLRQFLAGHAATEPAPPDLIYVHDFDRPQSPRAIRLPPGRGVELRDAMDHLVSELRRAIPAAFESEAYRLRREAMDAELRERRESALTAFEARAKASNVALVRTPVGMGLAPAQGDQVLGTEQFHQLPEAEQQRIRSAMSDLEEELGAIARRVQGWEREQRDRQRQLDRDVSHAAADHFLDEIRRAFPDPPEVLAHLDAVEQNVVETADEFVAAARETAEDGPKPQPAEAASDSTFHRNAPDAPFRRFRVNVLVDHGRTAGAPVVYEDNPTLANVVGRVEHMAQMGTLVTDFTLIKPGALHRANGGYLVLDALRLLQEPYAWEALKRALRAREVRIESPAQLTGMAATVSLQPAPIPLDVKVALLGERSLYHALAAADPDFLELFKVQADFEERIDRTHEADERYARLVATLGRREHLHPLEAGAVARALDDSSRRAGDQDKLSTHMRSLADLLREADHWATTAGRDVISAADVQRAIDSRHRRGSRLEEAVREEIAKGNVLIATDGAVVGEVNGLTVVQFGDTSFGQPVRITATVRLGRGEVVDIEREVDLGGPLHSKGVLILAGYLGARYSGGHPLTLHASLVFEQTYGGVEGDSASLAELCALLSAISGVPVGQGVAVTGSVNQHGAVQPIGGVNEKIEGFFDVCAARGLTGAQGVVIPASNVRNLMLRRDVVEAAADGRFHVWPVRRTDEAVELLCAMPAGEEAPGAGWPEGSVNARVAARLSELAEQARAYRVDA